MKKAENIVLGISIGDLNGVGSEVILKTFEDTRMLEFCTPVIFANVKPLSFLRKILGLVTHIQGIDRLDQLVKGKINVLNVWRENVAIEYGLLDDKVGKYAVKSFLAATKALKEGEIDVLVTAPINKYTVYSGDFKFPGHTDYLDQQLEGKAMMMMVSNVLKVGLVTDHIPINKITSYLKEPLIRTKVKTIELALIQDFGIHKPKIAVLGLNPHCGDKGIIGKEDDEIIVPAIKKMFDTGTLVFGPFSADSFFGSGQYEHYDAVVAMYHDQGLIPFKTLSFGQGVNYTAGLNKIRTSPDHGTAYDIAGKGIASFSSFREAVYLAIDVYNNRFQYKEISTGPLTIK